MFAARCSESQLEVARRLYQALVAQDPDRLITLRRGGSTQVRRTVSWAEHTSCTTERSRLRPCAAVLTC